MKVLVIGNGAREHAIAKKLSEDDVDLYAAMTRLNPGIAELCEKIDIMDINNPKKYREFNYDIVYIGPESVLASGVADIFTDKDIPVFGPIENLAKIETSKAFARQLIHHHGIEGNPDYSICRSKNDVVNFLERHEEVAVKPDVLTGGKGVKITGDHLNSREEVIEYALNRISDDGLVILEEKLKGEEFTLQAFTDGHHLMIMPIVRDFKRAFDGDKGPNTGSMGSYSCPDHKMPDLSIETVKKGEDIMKKTVKALTETVGEYKGVLYGGFMNTERGVYLIEYNARFGDPEAMNVLSLLDSSLLDIGFKINEGKLDTPLFRNLATVCVYLTPEGYPVNPVKDSPIEIGEINNSELYYASVYKHNELIKTTTSRAVALLGKGSTVEEARKNVYSDVSNITGRLHYRKDIADSI